jgi:hypothetical protein
MATTIQLLRSDLTQTRPEPNVLANGTPMVNLHESEPGLFFAARDGSLFKVGPAAIGPLPPNSFAQGKPGNSLGELWLDASAADPILKIYDGTDWVVCFDDPGGTVSSIGLSFDGLFSASGSPITSSGTIAAELDEQTAGSVLAGPASGPNAKPSFRSLSSSDIPGLPGEKITSGTINPARIANLIATQVTSGTFSPDRIPSLPADKITFGVLSPAVGGTGTTAIPTNGQLLIGTGTGWNVASLAAGPNIDVTPGLGTLQVGVSGASTFDSVALRDGTGDTLTLAAPNVTVPYALNLPSSDGTNGAILVTDGGGQLSFSSSLINISSVSGLASIVGLGALTIFSGGSNNNIILEPSGVGLVQIGDAATSPALRDNLTSLEIRLADNSDYTQVDAGVFKAAKPHTATAGVNQLPVGSVGQIARVTDASAPVIGSTVVGGGAAAALCWYNGSNWTVIGV